MNSLYDPACELCHGEGEFEVIWDDVTRMMPCPECLGRAAAEVATRKWRNEIVWHNGRRYRFTLEDERVIAAWIEVGARTPIRQPHWRKVGMTPATVAAANGNGLIVKE